MTTYVIHSRPDCGFCEKTKELLTRIGEGFQELIYETDEDRAHFKSKGFTTFPAIYRDDELIGGYTDLIANLRDAEDF